MGHYCDKKLATFVHWMCTFCCFRIIEITSSSHSIAAVAANVTSLGLRNFDSNYYISAWSWKLFFLKFRIRVQAWMWNAEKFVQKMHPVVFAIFAIINSAVGVGEIFSSDLAPGHMPGPETQEKLEKNQKNFGNFFLKFFSDFFFPCFHSSLLGPGGARKKMSNVSYDSIKYYLFWVKVGTKP